MILAIINRAKETEPNAEWKNRLFVNSLNHTKKTELRGSFLVEVEETASVLLIVIDQRVRQFLKV